jgi:hypothetical protein
MDENIEQAPDRKTVIANRIFYVLLALLLIGSVVTTFIKIVVLKNYQIVAETSCDPALESCFAYEDEETELYFYKLISKKASNIVACEATEEKIGCAEELSCIEDEENCSYTYCDPENLEEGQMCAEEGATLPTESNDETIGMSTTTAEALEE